MNLGYVLILFIFGLVVAYKLRTKVRANRYKLRGWKRLI